MKKAPCASTSSTAWPIRQARRSADRPCRRRSRRSFGRRHGPAASEGRPFHRKAPSSQHSRMASAGLIARTMLLTRHRKTASAFRSRDSATALPPFRPKLRARRGRPSKLPGRRLSAHHQRRRAALQSFAVRQEPLASPLVHTRQTRCSPHALSSCWTRFSPLIMHLRVHLSWIIIVAPPSDITISLVPGAGVPGNGTAAIGIIEAVVARFFTGGQQSLAMPPDMILDLSAGHSEGIGGGCG
jgi:hypothetical protein